MSDKIEIKLVSKSAYVPLIYQPIYKVILILAILTYNARSSSATMTLLHFITWAERNKSNEKILLDYTSGKRKHVVPWCFEPALDKAIIIAIINNYCTKLGGGKIKITAKGKKLVKEIELHNLFKNRINALKQIGLVEENDNLTNNWEVI